MLSLKYKKYKSLELLCKETNEHPYRQIQQIIKDNDEWVLIYRVEDCDETSEVK